MLKKTLQFYASNIFSVSDLNSYENCLHYSAKLLQEYILIVTHEKSDATQSKKIFIKTYIVTFSNHRVFFIITKFCIAKC